MTEPSHGLCADDVIITDELDRRPSRVPDYKAECQALSDLGETMAIKPDDVLQRLVEAAMRLTRADSAGISLLEPGGAHGVFRWVATAGAWAPYCGGTIPREESPCGEVIERDQMLVFKQPERAFPALLQSDPPTAEGLLTPFEIDGAPAGTVWVIKHDPDGRFDAEDARLVQSLARFASAAVHAAEARKAAEAQRDLEAADRARAEAELRENEQRLAAELSRGRLLQRLSTRLIPEQAAEALYEQILDTALELMGADAVSIQLLEEDGKRLRRVATRNLHPDSTEYWTWVDATHASTCGQALAKNERVMVEDVEAAPELAGTGDLEAFRASGTRAVQSSPLLTRTGRPIGMISTHWHAPRRFHESDFDLFDILARQVADLFERSRTEASLRESEERQAFLLKLSDALRPLAGPAEIMATASELLGRYLGVGRCGYGEVDATGEFLIVARDWTDGVMDSHQGTLRLADYGDAFMSAYRAGRTVALDDVFADARAQGVEAAIETVGGLRASLAVPLLKDGRWISVLYVQQSSARHWTAEEEALVREVGERTWAAVERARAEAALHSSEERYRELFERIDEGFCIVEMIFDDDGKPVDYRFVAVNPAFEGQTGIADAEGRRMRDIAPDHEQHWFDHYGAIALTGLPERFEAPAMALGARWYDLNAFRVGDPAQRRVAILFNDITQRQRDAAALRHSEERLRGVLDGMGEGFGVIGPDYTILEYNREALRMDGRPKAEIVGRSHWDVFPGTECSEVGLLLKRAMADRQPASLEHRYAWEEGRALWLDLRVYPMADGALAVFWRDVTERRAAEDLLRESEERFAQFAASTTDVLWIRDVDTMALEYISPAFESVFGVTIGSVSGGIEPGAALVDPADRERVMEHLDAAGRGEPQIYEFRIVHGSDGGARWIRDNCFPLIDGAGRVERIGGIARDVTELKLAEEALRESEERQAFLLRLSDALRPLADPEEIRLAAAEVLGRHLGANRIAYAENIGDEFFQVARNYVDCATEVKGRLRYADYRSDIVSELAAGRTRVQPDIANDSRLSDAEKRAFADVEVGASLDVPLVKGGALVAFLGVNYSAAHDFEPREIALATEVAERTWAAVERARAEAALRESEARHRFRVELGDALHGLASPSEIMAIVAERLGPYLGVDQASYYEIEGERFVVTREWRTEATPGVVGSHQLADFGPSNEARLRAGEVIRLNDTHGVDGSDAFTSINIAALLSVPLHRDGRWAAGLHVLQARPRAWTDDEEALVREVAAHTWAAVDRAQVETALRESEERLAAAFEGVPVGAAVVDLSGATMIANSEYRRFLPTGVVPSHDPIRGARWRGWDAQGRLLDLHDFPAARALRGESVVPGQEMLYTDDDGREIWTSVATVPTRDEQGRVTGLVTAIADIDAAKRGSVALRESEERLRALMEGIPQLVWRAGEPGHWTWASPQWTTFTGQEAADSRDWGWLEPLHPDDRDMARKAWDDAVEQGSLDVEYRIRAHESGTYRWFQTRAVPVRNGSGAVVEWLGTSTDVDELRRLQDLQKTLLAELQHRVRNVLAVIRSMMRRSSESQESLSDYVQHLEGRLSALARTQVLLTRAVDARVDLEDLIRDELVAQAANEDQITLNGPAIDLSPKAAEVVSLAIHELTTNAVKYGALSRQTASLDIEWQVEERASTPWLKLAWSELGVSVTTTAPRRQGFGSELITRRVPYELQGKGSLEMRPGRIECRLEFPLRDRASILQTDARPATASE